MTKPGAAGALVAVALLVAACGPTGGRAGIGAVALAQEPATVRTAAMTEERANVRAMMEESGMVEQLADLDEHSRASVLNSDSRQLGLSSEEVTALADISGKVMNPERLLADLEAELTATLSSEEVAAMREFYRTPLGQRLKQAEVAGSTPRAQKEIESQMSTLAAALEGDPDRHALLQRIDKALFASELTTTMIVESAYALTAGVTEGLQVDPGPGGLASVRAQIEGMHDTFAAQVRNYMRAAFAYYYRDISTAELKTYTEFLETDSARAVYAAFHAAMGEILGARSLEIGKGIAAYLKQKRA